MKYVTLVIMTILIFGIAISPIFSNGLVYAQSEKTEKEKKEQRSDDSKQQKIEQEAQAEERESQRSETQNSKEKRVEDSEAKQQKLEQQQERLATAQELQEQRRAELAERNQILMERFAEQDKIEDESPITEVIDQLIDVLEPELIPDQVDNLPVPRNDNAVNIPFDKTTQYFSNLSDMISEQKRTQDRLFSQMSVLLNLVNSMCEGKVIVVGVSDGMPRCIDNSSAVDLHNRGMVTLLSLE